VGEAKGKRLNRQDAKDAKQDEERREKAVGRRRLMASAVATKPACAGWASP
jgi:hypothetical protein